ncbi:MAG: cation-translocating P-type ATPase, partial [Emergencia sp.]
MFYDKSIDSIYEKFGSRESGLSDEQVGKNRDAFGANALREKKKKSVAAVFLSQFKDLLVVILIIAAAISFATGSAESSLVIILVLVLNAVLGTVQSIKADKSLESLKKLSSPMAKVTRHGEDMEIDASELVCGDIIRLEAGDIVPADARIISCHSFMTNESALTGESEPVDKTAKTLGGFTEKDISPGALADANHTMEESLSPDALADANHSREKNVPSSELADANHTMEESLSPDELSDANHSREKNVSSSMLADANHEKNTDFSDSPEILALGDQKNMVFSSSLVTNGRAIAIVTAVGTSSELGKIAEDLNTAAQRKTPLQVTMDNFSKKLSIAILVVCAVVFALTVYRGGAVADALLFAIALAVAAIPEALSSIITISLAIGTTRMAKENAIVKNLSAVEGLGSVSVICSDKTGTLTQNKMTVTDLWCLNTDTSISKIYSSDKNSADPNKHSHSEKLLELAAVLCNDSTLADGQLTGDPTETALISYYEKLCKGKFPGSGMNHSQCPKVTDSDMNPSQCAEASVSDMNPSQCAKGTDSDAGHSSPWKLRDRCPRIAELPFDSDRKLMSTLNIVNTQTGTESISQADSPKGIGTKSFSAADSSNEIVMKSLSPSASSNGIGGRILMFTKGAPDVVLGRATGLSEADKSRILATNEAFSSRGLRVLAFAYKDFDDKSSYTDSKTAPVEDESPSGTICDDSNSADTSGHGNPKLSLDDENNLIFLGLIAMMDPPRTESAAAVADCIRAGIKPIMITGDHKVTAAAIAKEIGILREEATSAGAADAQAGMCISPDGLAEANSDAMDDAAGAGHANSGTQVGAAGAQAGMGISPDGLAEANSDAIYDAAGARSD